MTAVTRTPPTLEHPIRTLPVQTTTNRDASTSNQSQKPKMQGRIDIANLTQNNIGQLRKLNSVLFPVRFGEKWYKDVLKEDVKEICKYALFNDIPVGNICCRFEKSTTKDDSVNVHIMTLGCLAPYRRMGIATALLEYVLDHAAPGKKVEISDSFSDDTTKTAPTKPTAKPSTSKKEVKQTKSYTVAKIYLHVQTSNEEAKVFYEKNGFTEKERVEQYYKTGIEPRSAWLLEKE
ncbi:acyl-CoA N-acyltransferase [Meira miltonrushii]|uniref:Acyl-CoA N-acyltransferase n=1 Tax=Meira miltonrushii TaxID=1280837 RepID=A0A316V4V5_9BASI|nr:acyl-CoA N-acyltransferase [Meira miltonrushii]PWN32576.1 acyl-CoA N-acyltransferase [Meira miltonrushii]